MDEAACIKKGEIGVIPTDTIYGLVGSALIPSTVERIYAVRERNSAKPFIVLISGSRDLKRFGVSLDKTLGAFCKKFWPGKVSIVIGGIGEEWKYLHRGTRSLAFRVPDKKELLLLLSDTGPLVAPSANTEGKSPATTIEAAKKYFADSVDFYIDGGELTGEPSTLVSYQEGEFRVLRQGAVRVS